MHSVLLRHRLKAGAILALSALILAGCASVAEESRDGIQLLTATGDQPGDEALITGRITLTMGGCVGIATQDGDVHLVIWPQRTTLASTDPVEVSLPSGLTVTAGEDIEGSGGYYTSPDELADQINLCDADAEVIRIRFD